MFVRNCLLTFCVIIVVPPVWANRFNPAFLSSDPNAIASLEHFESDDNQLPGTYRVDIYLNNNFIESRDVVFIQDKNNGGDTGLIPAFTPKDWEELGANTSAFPVFQDEANKDKPVAIADVIPMASTLFDFNAQRLDISIPQAAVKNRARGFVSPELWDEGIPALLFNYNYSGSNSNDNDSGSELSQFLGLNSGLNIGSWRLRDYSTWNKNDSSEDIEHISTTLSRAIIPLKSHLVMGDTSTPGDIFDSIPFRGVQMLSDDGMYPDSMRGYAPIVRGIAKGNAKVTIKQNGFTIYQTHVSPGAFAIEDLYATSNSGDLLVEVEEADGSINRYTVAYSTLPSLQREGRIKYSVTAGEHRSGNDQQDEAQFTQGTLSWGLPHGVTVYGGTQLSSDYRSAAMGLGFNLGEWGAVSVDATHANTTLADDSEHTGQSFRFQYAKSLNEYGTNVQFMGYRYSTSGYYSFAESTWKAMEGAIYENDEDDDIEDTSSTVYYNLHYTKRGRLQANISQNLGDTASLYISGSQQSYWNTDETDSNWQAGFSDTWRYINYSLSLSYSKSAWSDDSDKTIALSISVPLDRLLNSGSSTPGNASNPVNLSMSTSRDDDGYTSTTAGLSGTLLEDKNLSYSVQQGYRNMNGNGYYGNTTMQYRGRHGNLNVGYNYSDGYNQLNYGASGGLVIHGNGITLSQPLGDTNILVAAPGAAGVKVESGTGIKTDYRGYTVMPYATTYRNNRVALDTGSLGDDVELETAVVNVVPTKGALVKAEFSALVGGKALLTLNKGNKPVPFGAVVSVEGSKSTGIVGDDGMVYLSGLTEEGILSVSWGEDSTQKCKARWRFPEKEANKSIIRTVVHCE
ncbi:fimbrial biogenesis usher protein [Enterobacter mori]|uniref:fimbrial biogenesis usher protein n=1 Tax=Enterobacter mori TaxID=539813 RepID=UPI003B840FFE